MSNPFLLPIEPKPHYYNRQLAVRSYLLNVRPVLGEFNRCVREYQQEHPAHVRTPIACYNPYPLLDAVAGHILTHGELEFDDLFQQARPLTNGLGLSIGALTQILHETLMAMICEISEIFPEMRFASGKVASCSVTEQGIVVTIMNDVGGD